MTPPAKPGAGDDVRKFVESILARAADPERERNFRDRTDRDCLADDDCYGMLYGVPSRPLTQGEKLWHINRCRAASGLPPLEGPPWPVEAK